MLQFLDLWPNFGRIQLQDLNFCSTVVLECINIQIVKVQQGQLNLSFIQAVDFEGLGPKTDWIQQDPGFCCSVVPGCIMIQV